MADFFTDDKGRIRKIESRVGFAAQAVEGQVPVRIPIKAGQFEKFFTREQVEAGVMFTRLPTEKRRGILKKAIRTDGARTVANRLRAQVIFRKDATNPKIIRARKVFEKDLEWINKKFKKNAFVNSK